MEYEENELCRLSNSITNILNHVKTADIKEWGPSFHRDIHSKKSDANMFDVVQKHVSNMGKLGEVSEEDFISLCRYAFTHLTLANQGMTVRANKSISNKMLTKRLIGTSKGDFSKYTADNGAVIPLDDDHGLLMMMGIFTKALYELGNLPLYISVKPITHKDIKETTRLVCECVNTSLVIWKYYYAGKDSDPFETYVESMLLHATNLNKV